MLQVARQRQTSSLRLVQVSRWTEANMVYSTDTKLGGTFRDTLKLERINQKLWQRGSRNAATLSIAPGGCSAGPDRIRLPYDDDEVYGTHLSLDYVRFGCLVPSVLNRIESSMIANELRTSVLAPVGIGLKWAKQVQYALNHASAGESIDYERLEFLGDCILKLLVCLQLLVDHPLWPEGYLVKEMGKWVSNNHLAIACIKTGVYKYINTTVFYRPWLESTLRSRCPCGCCRAGERDFFDHRR